VIDFILKNVQLQLVGVHQSMCKQWLINISIDALQPVNTHQVDLLITSDVSDNSHQFI
jgi:hypothetical protein